MNVLVTGASRGLGLALAAHYAREPDALVFAGARSPDAAPLLEAAARADGRLVPVALDVDDPASVASAAARVGEAGTLHLLINAAGIANWDKLERVGAEAFVAILRTNVVGPALVIKALAKRLARGSTIVNLTSVFGSIERAHGSGGIAYPASKAALNMVTKQVSATLGGRGVVTIALHPGWVRTAMGGRGAALSVEESVAGMTRVIAGLEPADNGAYLQWDGARLPW